MTNDENVPEFISALIDALDSSPLVCLIPDNPALVYGPFTPLEAMDFCDTWNTFYEAKGLPGRWVAVNMLSANA